MAQTETRRSRGLDVLRALAIGMVVTIHVSSAGLSGAVGTPDWWGALFWGSVARPAVPLFFLCSGALMMDRDIPLRRLLSHNVLRIVLAMFAWAYVYQVYELLTGGGVTLAGLWEAAKRTLLFQHAFHFYYLHILLLVYAFLPVARVFLRHASRREIEYLLAFWFVTGILFPLIQHFWPFSLVPPIGIWYRMNMSYAAIGYGVLGCYLRRYGSGASPGWYALAWAAGLALTFGGTAVSSLQAGTLSEIFLEGMSPGPMLMALGLFGLAANREHWPLPVERATNRLARAAFCVYLVHILALQGVNWLGLDQAGSPCGLTIPVTALAVLALSWLCWEILRHIPLVKTYLI